MPKAPQPGKSLRLSSSDFRLRRKSPPGPDTRTASGRGFFDMRCILREIILSMRRLATWAAGHRATARVLVILCYLLINVAGIAFSLMLPGDTRSASWLVLTALLLAAGCAVSFTGSGPGKAFRSRKYCDLSLCLATLLFVTGNISLRMQPASGTSGSVSVAGAAMLPVHAVTHHKHTIQERFVQARHWFAEQSSGVKILLIVLTVILTAGLIYLWAAVCCGIICNGLEALGYFLFFAGAAGAIFGCVRVIQRILRGRPRRRTARR